MDHEDGKPCPLCASKEKQKILSTRDFVCRECGEPLTKVGGDDGNGSKLVKYVCIGVGALAVLGGGGFGIYKAVSPSEPKEVSLNHCEKTLYVGDKDTLRATLSPEKSEGTLVWKTSNHDMLTVDDGVVTALKEGEGKVQVSVVDVDGVKCVCKYTIKAKKEGTEPTPTPPVEPKDTLNKQGNGDTPTNGLGKDGKTTEEPKKVDPKPVNPKPVNPKPAAPKPSGINLGYGTYKGETLNGKPHGYGTITFKKTHRLISSKDYIAEPGDKYEGEFRNGQISGGAGYFYHDGDIIRVKP